MRKGQQRSPLPAPALTEKDRAHLNWIRRNSTLLVRSALKRYREGGRGACVIREEDAKPSGTAAHSLTVTGVQTTEIRWPDGTTAELVRTYNPAQQFVIVFLYRSGAASEYKICFVKMGIHSRSKPPSSPPVSRITRASGCCEGRHNPNKHSSRLCLFGSPDLRTAHVVHPHWSQTYPYPRVGASPSRGGGRHPLRLAARTIRFVTTCDPRCWRCSSRNVSAASTSATRLAGTEISKCPLFPFSDRRVTFICSP